MTNSMQPLWTSADAATVTGGESTLPWQATGLSIDTRTLSPGDLFVALKGPHFDGHDFSANALAKGAAAAMIDHLASGISDNQPLLRVADTMAALEKMAIASRTRSAAQVIAVTGSVGKTGTKEALYYVLSRQADTHASAGSLNNHWGVPLSLARMPVGAIFGIFEFGMNHPGEIAPLSKMARPHVALITTVESVHSEFFENVEQIADAKAEIFSGLEPGGTAVLNRDNQHFERLAAAAKEHGAKQVISFGVSESADMGLTGDVPQPGGTDVSAEFMGTSITYRLGVPGRHWVINSLGVLAVVAAAGGNVIEAAAALAGFTSPKGRGETHTIGIDDGTFTLIDESYNASPVSMIAAFQVLGRTEPGPGGRRIAVLGDMLELGASSAKRHTDLAGPLQKNNVDLVFTAGSEMALLSEALPGKMRGGHGADSDEMLALIQEAVRPGDVVVVKGSAGSKTGLIVEALVASAANNARPKRAANGE